MASVSGPDAATFLNNVLSARPNTLPYAEDVKWQIRSQLLSLLHSYPGLTARTATFTHNDGRTVTVLQAEGTIPMVYQNVKYNIPVTLWLLEAFPKTCPMVYVTPARNMIIRQRHPFVDGSGLVAVPYMREWVFPRSSLVGLVEQLSAMFGSDPPLYSRPSEVSPPRQQHPYIPPSRAEEPVATGPRPGTSSSSASPSSMTTEDPAEVFRQRALVFLAEQLKRDVEAHTNGVKQEMERLLTDQGLLAKRAEGLAKGIAELQGEKGALEQQLQMALHDISVMEPWLKANDKSSVEVDVETAFEPVDPLSQQLLGCTAEDLALEDTIYSLDKGLQEGKVQPEVYLKLIRNLSNHQFFERATAIRIRAMQNSAHVNAMAARAPLSYQ